MQYKNSASTNFFKVPTAFGYAHLGDCMIILTVCLFGTKRGVLAGGIIHTIGYVLVNALFYRAAAASVEIYPNTVQSTTGVILGVIAYLALSKSPFIRELKNKLN